MKTLAEKSREVLERYRESIDIEDATDDDGDRDSEVTAVHVHIPPPTKSDSTFDKLKAVLITAGLAAGTGIVAAVMQHCG